MSCFPLRLGVSTALLALVVAAATPAYAKHARANTGNPNNPPSQTQTGAADQTVNTVPPQANQGQAGSYPGAANQGSIPSAYPPNSVYQQARPQYVPQYLPNAYVSTVPPNASAPPNQYLNQIANQGRPGNSPVASSPPGNTPETPTNSGIGVADQYPPKPPRVSFRNGQLSIMAENCTLPDILTAIHQRTGAAMELPTTLGNERVAVKLGPASTGDVLAALLNGSHFDYIVLNRPEDPSSPERIILREKVTAADNNNNNGYNNGASAQPVYQPPPEVQETPETVPEEEEPEAAPGQSVDNTSTPPTGDQNPGNAKTPEELLQELRQMQQQRGQQPQFQPQQPPLVDNGQPQ